ncbi:Phasin domain-containing protein [Sphingomonas antarctica]|uniref:phasin family protein n=1 Tax=Sphingomonas antarctica TaxID=2040274 RepID=UPI0039E9CA4F
MMAKDSTDAKKGTLENATDAVKRAGESVKDAASHAAQNAASLNAKVIDHAEENVREAFRALRAAAGSTSVQDVVKAQTDYVKDQGARSMTQAKEIGEMIAQFGRTAMEAWRPKS